MLTPWQQPRVIHQSTLILESYRHWLGEELLSHPADWEETAHLLFEAPFVVVSHGLGKDPILNYGNRQALELWEMTWDSFIQTPSRLTAEILSRPERAAMLKKVSAQGFSKDYRGVRVSSSGRRFRIEQAVIWNILDKKHHPFGQAAAFHRWTYLEGNS
jgi:MEKHLA domain-containing protein